MSIITSTTITRPVILSGRSRMRMGQPWWHTHASVGEWRGNPKSEHSPRFRSDSLFRIVNAHRHQMPPRSQSIPLRHEYKPIPPHPPGANRSPPHHPPPPFTVPPPLPVFLLYLSCIHSSSHLYLLRVSRRHGHFPAYRAPIQFKRSSLFNVFGQ